LMLGDENSNNLSKESKEYIQIIQKSMKAQLNYINDLLDLIKFESDDIPITLEETNFIKILDICLPGLKLLAKNKNITINIENFSEEKIKVDVPKIIQILNNLISNAIKFTNIGGTININIFKNNINEIEFHVIDTGIGIPEEKLEKLFANNKKFSSTGTAGEKGTGLGLEICKRLVEIHGGKINAISGHKGSNFYFTIPLSVSKATN